MSKVIKLKVGDIVWLASYPLLSYKVLAEIKRDMSVQYEIECMQCNHSGNCRVLIGDNDYGELEYKDMVSEDECSEDKQYYFHRNGVYKKTKEEAYIYRIEEYIRKEEQSIKKHREGIEYSEKEIGKFKESLEMYKKTLSTQSVDKK